MRELTGVSMSLCSPSTRISWSCSSPSLSAMPWDMWPAMSPLLPLQSPSPTPSKVAFYIIIKLPSCSLVNWVKIILCLDLDLTMADLCQLWSPSSMQRPLSSSLGSSCPSHSGSPWLQLSSVMPSLSSGLVMNQPPPLCLNLHPLFAFFSGSLRQWLTWLFELWQVSPWHPSPSYPSTGWASLAPWSPTYRSLTGASIPRRPWSAHLPPSLPLPILPPSSSRPLRPVALTLFQTDMDSTNVYAYISIIALIVCLPPAIIVSKPSEYNDFYTVWCSFFF